MDISINHSETSGPNVDDFESSSSVHSCFIPICQYSFMANKSFLQEYLPWAIRKCINPKIIIGDYMERHNIMVFDSLSEDEAIEKALKQGLKVYNTIHQILLNKNLLGNVSLESCRTIIDSDICERNKQILRNYIAENASIEFDIREQTKRMLKNSKDRLGKSIDDLSGQDLKRLHEYMVEEIAFFITLYQQGYTTEIYPGRDMKILRKMATSRYRSFPFEFSERTHISVSLLLDSGTSYARIDN